jgi:histidine kinase/DNA gyrase B/HSP90-like ATPase
MSSWLEVDVDGLRKTLSRKGKVCALHELIQNSWDAEATEVNVTLTKPKDGTSTLTCLDNAPGGFADLTHAHTLFAESDKKDKVQKRGRFSAGDKYVLALMRSATVTSTTGQIVFQANGQRKTNDKHTEVGSEFKGVLNMTEEDYDDILSRIFSIIPPVNIATFVNGKHVPMRKPVHTFKVTLPSEIADDAGILRSRKREATVNLYAVQDGEKPTLYEMGIPVVPVDENLKWHVDIQQKVPLNIERDNVTPSYLREVFAAVLNEKVNELSEEDASAAWVTTGMESKKATATALNGVITKRFGEGAVRRDYGDKGSNREAQSRDRKVVERGSFTKAVWDNINQHRELLPKAGEVCPTDFTGLVPLVKFPREEWTPQMVAYADFLGVMAPELINHTITVEYVKDDRVEFRGCTRWKKGSFVMEINLEYHNVADWQGNIYLMLHEFAHHRVQSNDHLWRRFYDTVNTLGARLVKLALRERDLFSDHGVCFGSDTADAFLTMMERRFAGLRENLHDETEDEVEAIAASQA